MESINRVAHVYVTVNGGNNEQIEAKMVDNIKNTLTDRATVNHATDKHLENTWNKDLHELNCHLHPLDSIASSARTTLKGLQPSDMKGPVYGNDCTAVNIVLGFNKLRYKDRKGDPKGFTAERL